jgi:predicted patatin/cPLA2 family phospholipase
MSSPASIPVREVVLNRIVTGSEPGRRLDPWTVALCIEGGGMRGVVSAGMVVAIEQLGILSAFDRVYGASAGAMNGAYLLAGQAAFGTTIYYENINNRHFIDFTRPLRGKPIVDIDFVAGQVMEHEKRLDCETVLSHEIPLNILASDAAGGRHVVLRATTPEGLRRALRAGATMPLVAGGPYELDGMRLWDASMTEPIPTRVAKADGCTHLVVLLTRPEGQLRPTLSPFERWFLVPTLGRHSPELAQRHQNREADYREIVQSLDNDDTVLPIRPRGPIVSKLEKDPVRLMAGAASGMEAAIAALPRLFP